MQKCIIVAQHDGVIAAGPLKLREGSQVRERQIVLILTRKSEKKNNSKRKSPTSSGGGRRSE